MTTKASERETAIAAADGTCPRCGAERQPDQRYCLDCGLVLPAVDGRLPALRRRWIRRFGWYPGDWVWISLLTLLIAAAGAATAILLTESRTSNQGNTFAATTAITSVTEPATVPATTAPTTVDTRTLPTAPEPTTSTPTKPKPGPKNGRLTWPANENGWTIVLVSYPKLNGQTAATDTAARAAKAGLKQVGVLDSSSYASLQPGYLVVFTGIYGSKADADAAVSTARQAGFGGAYSRQIAR
ncbi:MAG TPA: zinc ribbon domain-containing protein [Gaiellaceae bacterium]